MAEGEQLWAHDKDPDDQNGADPGDSQGGQEGDEKLPLPGELEEHIEREVLASVRKGTIERIRVLAAAASQIHRIKNKVILAFVRDPSKIDSYLHRQEEKKRKKREKRRQKKKEQEEKGK